MNYKSILEGQVRELQKVQDKIINEGLFNSPQIQETSKQILEIVKYLYRENIKDDDNTSVELIFNAEESKRLYDLVAQGMKLNSYDSPLKG